MALQRGAAAECEIPIDGLALGVEGFVRVQVLHVSSDKAIRMGAHDSPELVGVHIGR